MGTRKGAVKSTPIGREERSKWLFEREEFDGGAFRYLNTNVSFEGHHDGGGAGDEKKGRASAQELNEGYLWTRPFEGRRVLRCEKKRECAHHLCEADGQEAANAVRRGPWPVPRP